MFFMDEMKRLIKKYGGKKEVAALLEITVRYVEMILAGTRTPGKHLLKIMKIYL